MIRKRIGIIGAGYVGKSLAMQFVKLGHFVKVANSRGAETLRDIERQTGAQPADLEGVVADIDLLFIAIPLANIPALEKIAQSLSEHVVFVDTGNYYPPRDGSIREIELGVPDTVWTSQQLRRPVVKVFNPIDNLVRASRLMVGLDRFKPKSWWAVIKLTITIIR